MENVAPPADTTIETKAPEKQRLYYFDLLRTVAIVAMVFCHVVISLGDHEEGFASHFGYFFGAVVLGDVNWIAALSAGAFGFVVAILFALAGLPEVKEEEDAKQVEDASPILPEDTVTIKAEEIE